MRSAHLEAPERMTLLRQLDLLQPHSDASFDRVTAIAAAATGCPVALVTFVGADGQWLGSHHGLQEAWQPLSASFCVYTLDDSCPLEIEDAARDGRFIDHPMVRAGLRFYMGYPIVFDAVVLGTVCVLDRRPRRLDQAQADMLGHLAGLVGDLLRVRLERSRAVQAEVQRAETEQRLRKSQKLEAIGVLAGGIAHDFNNIIGGILGHVELARAAQGRLQADARNESLEQIRKAAGRGRDMVQQILAFAKRRPVLSGPCNVRELIHETLALLRPMAPPNVVVTARCAEQLTVQADGTQVEQALINLCVNAWQAMRGRPGAVVVSAEAVHITGSAEEPAELACGAYVRIVVSDDGPGMDEATAAHAFEAFFTTKPEGEGTGLGLAMVQSIAKRHGGAVTLATSPGHGAAFSLWLPAAEAKATPTAEVGSGQPTKAGPAGPVQASNATDALASTTVIYVDDDEVMRTLVEGVLEQQGYRVFCHASAQDVLVALDRTPSLLQRVAAVVTDLRMPGTSGAELLRTLRARRPDLPVIVATGELSEALKAELIAAGAAGVYEKQDVVPELARCLARVLQQSHKPSRREE